MVIEGKTIDEFQLKAINDKGKSVLLIAGAGSGKTLTILAKIKWLLEHNYKEDEILAISFTNKTVEDLKKRLNNINITIDVFTFHKLGINLLQNNNYSIINDNHLMYIINEYFLSYVKYNKCNLNKLKNYLYINNEDNLFKSIEFNNLKNLIYTFIKLSKSNSMNVNDIYNIYKKRLLKDKYILKIILEIYTLYQSELESTNKIDFDDIIINATKNIKNLKLKYKYIIIDEFQDTSLLRINLIKEIIKYTNSSIFCVGDDYQSIYRFSGCNLDLFLNFKKHFKNAHIHYLKNTYRYSNELIKVTNSFIMKNKKQLKKEIVSNKNLKKPIKILMNKTINESIKFINDQELLILGRNNKDIDNIEYNNKLTIHKSKGLEANNVLIVNSENIPNKIENHKILNYVLTEKDSILYEEERRVFYVALTRTKNNVYILVNKKISPFVKELIKNYKDYIEIIN